MKRLLTVLFLVVSGFGYSQKPTDPIGSDSSKVNWVLFNDLVIQEINIEREKLGIPMLIKDSTIMAFSKKHNMWMIKNGKFEHSHNGDGIYAECIAGSYSASTLTYSQCVKILVDTWKSSSSHWKILMSSKYSKCGVHVYTYSISGLIPGYNMKSTFNLK